MLGAGEGYGIGLQGENVTTVRLDVEGWRLEVASVRRFGSGAILRLRGTVVALADGADAVSTEWRSLENLDMPATTGDKSGDRGSAFFDFKGQGPLQLCWALVPISGGVIASRSRKWDSEDTSVVFAGDFSFRTDTSGVKEVTKRVWVE